jgi:predicted phage baseplate assembly protein
MLPAPNLDDRRFQQLVDDAKRLVQQRCPEWTDHNVSDPGVTLIEAFAQMVDQLIYRLNRVPDLHYIKFLELIGVELRPPAAARGTVTFWLSAPQPQPVLVRAETEVATPRTDVHEPIVFGTSRDLQIVPCSYTHLATQAVGAPPVDMSTALSMSASSETTAELASKGIRCFPTKPKPAVGDALLVGLSNAVPSCAVTLRMRCPIAGHGIDPRRPPRVWEAWTDNGWVACDLEKDETRGLNQPGDIVLHVPEGHQASIIAKNRGGWLRCRVVETEDDQPSYSDSPTVQSVTAFTIGGTAPTSNAEVVRGEVIGRSDGTAGQRFPLQRRPVLLADAPAQLTVLDGTDEQTWFEVASFADSGAGDRHFRLDKYAGEVQFAPAVRSADGTVMSYGAVPSSGAVVRIQTYRTGGGRAGNVARGQVRVLKTSVPYVARVQNRHPAVGGAEAETLADAKARGPMLLRSRGRAVTAEDFEQLAKEVAPEAARVHCVAEGSQAAGVRVLVVPHLASDEVGGVRFEDLDPPEATLQRISNSLDERRLVGTRLLVQRPDYVGLTVVVSVSARRGHEPAGVRTEVLQALYSLFHPLYGGPDRTGWPLGRSVQSHEVHAALARIAGVDMSREVNVALFPADAKNGQRGAAVHRLDLPDHALVYSYDHQVRVSR